VSSAEVTMFQPARPWLAWSSVERRAARSYGWLKVVDIVATRPMLSVCPATAASAISGSGRSAMSLLPIPGTV
jgi:hypothetical protein